jgi:lipopolysaccharide assembly outer membrane protein LptD (OstA)
MKITGSLLFLIICNLCSLFTYAQTNDSIAPKKTQVYLEHANTLSFNKAIDPDNKVLIGSVVFRHDSSYMYCDSAYFYELSNSLEAFSNVRMEQGDTLFIYGDWLYYDGNTQLARLRKNVRMENRQVRLFTDSLNYNRIENMGYYFNGGRIIDKENELSSFFGQYSPDTKEAVFNDSVQLVNPQFILYSDTLHYNTDTKIATILGPSVIESDSGTVYSSKGWYNTQTNVSLLLDHSHVVSGNRILVGDSIYYDKDSGFSEVFGNMSLRDTSQMIILEGQYGYYNEKTEFAFATDSARFLEYSRGDTLYLHADTLLVSTIDSAYRELKAYHGVRFYRIDLQGVCDSMIFNSHDSVLYMYSDPVLWNDMYQIYGDTILVYMNDSTVDYAHIIQFAFAVQFLDTTYYNQLKGNDMVAYFEGNTMRQIDVSGNAESIFYPVDNGSMAGMNQTKSSYLTIWLKENKLERVKFWPGSEGDVIPIPDLLPEQKTLRDFYWFDYLRPVNSNDIYRKEKRKTGDAPKRSNKFIH